MSSDGSPLGAAGVAVLGTITAATIWQALAQFVWTIYPYPCNEAADYSACKAGPGREYADFLGFFDEKLYTMIMHYVVAFAIAGMIAVLVIVAIACYAWADDHITAGQYRRRTAKKALQAQG